MRDARHKRMRISSQNSNQRLDAIAIFVLLEIKKGVREGEEGTQEEKNRKKAIHSEAAVADGFICFMYPGEDKKRNIKEIWNM